MAKKYTSAQEIQALKDRVAALTERLNALINAFNIHSHVVLAKPETQHFMQVRLY
jgi:hypothetical protein